MQVKNEPLIYRNPTFAIHHLIEDCPPSTVIRELTRNAIDAAILASPPGRIAWFKEEVEGIDKLGIYNEGPGMSGLELAELTDVASTTKVLSIDDNYGQGGKISGLKASPFGLIYRSCNRGVVSQIILAREVEGNRTTYVKKRQPVDGSWDTVIDVTEAVRERGDRDLSKDWTEVVMLGKSADHDTVKYLLSQTDGVRWLARLINRRFYRLPEGISIDAANITTGDPISRNARGLESQILGLGTKRSPGFMENDTTVNLGGISIRYLKLTGTHAPSLGSKSTAYNRRQTLDAYGISPGGDHACIVWRNECYDFRPGLSKIGGQFGIRYGASDIAIHVMLPHHATIKDNTYRDSLIDPANENRQIRLDDYAEMIREYRPQWLMDYINALESNADSSDDVMERLRKFVDELKVSTGRQSEVKKSNDEKTEGQEINHSDSGGGGGGGSSKNSEPKEPPKEPKHKPLSGVRIQSNLAGIPVPKFTTDPAHLEAMRGRAAMYVKEENVIWINPEHFRYNAFLEEVEKEAGNDAERQQLAKRIFNDEYKFQVGKYVASAWVYKGRPDWNDVDWEKALDAGSLTIHLTPPDCLISFRREFHRQVGK